MYIDDPIKTRNLKLQVKNVKTSVCFAQVSILLIWETGHIYKQITQIS